MNQYIMEISMANDELDAKEIYALYSTWANEKISPKTPKITFKELKETLKKSTTFLAKIEGKMAGFLICKIKKSKEDTIMYHLKKGENYAEIDSIYVLKNYRKKGIGKELILFCKKELKKNGYKKIIVLADSSNLKNLMDFYEKNGFNPLFASMICED
jgi:ribosomal protein S18 acetylase RimI-like enzyme